MWCFDLLYMARKNLILDKGLSVTIEFITLRIQKDMRERMSMIAGSRRARSRQVLIQNL